METLIIERISRGIPAAPPISRNTNTCNRAIGLALDRDIAEIAIGFGNRFGSRAKSEFGATTAGSVTFRKVDPLHEPFEVADKRLQSRLESLCETLRAKY